MGFTVPISYSYDAVGNLLSKTDYANTYRYGNAAKNLGGNAGSNAVRQVIKLNNSTVNFSYDNQGNLTAGDGLAISYNSFKQPTQITRNGNTFGFTYGANLERLKETRNGITTYEIDKLYEEESNGNWRIYLQDIAIIKYDATDKHQIRYTHKDRLGSTLTYTDHNGQVTDRRMFDAFGKPRATDGNSLTTPRLQNLSLSRNGFTDHRHLDEVELIHMNGRAYDYNLGRFLSVDPIIQSPGNSQSLNPYSYIMNNPLAGTDPTGYCSKELGSNICSKEPSSVQVSATLAGNMMAKAAQAAVSENGARQSQPQTQAGQQASVTDIETQQNKAQVKGGQWANQDGSPSDAPSSFNGTETAGAGVGIGPFGLPIILPKSPEQVAREEEAAKGLTSAVRELAGSFGSPNLPPDDEDKQEIRGPRSKLGKNLEANGMKRPGNEFDAHHMVPVKVKEAAAARAVLQKYNIDINSHLNGVWIPRGAHTGKGGIHSFNRSYGEAVSTRLRYASSRESAEKILSGIRRDIRDGVEFWR